MERKKGMGKKAKFRKLGTCAIARAIAFANARAFAGKRFLVRPCLPYQQALFLSLRKEVIQPHFPVRLPCYDFAPIIGLTFDGSLSCELGHRLLVLPTFMA